MEILLEYNKYWLVKKYHKYYQINTLRVNAKRVLEMNNPYETD